MYEVQLNAYAYIGQTCGLAPVSRLALIYMEPATDDDAVADPANARSDGFAIGQRPEFGARGVRDRDKE